MGACERGAHKKHLSLKRLKVFVSKDVEKDVFKTDFKEDRVQDDVWSTIESRLEKQLCEFDVFIRFRRCIKLDYSRI